MAVRNDSFGGDDWSDGEVLDAEDLNDTFDATPRIIGIDNSDDLDIDISTSDGNKEETKDKTYSFSSGKANGVEINPLFHIYASNDDPDWSEFYLTIEIREDGGDFREVLPETMIHKNNGDGTTIEVTQNVTKIIELTEGEIENGFDIKLTTRVFLDCGPDYANGTITNKGITFKAIRINNELSS